MSWEQTLENNGQTFIIRNTEEGEIDNVIDLENKPENRDFVEQWSREEHYNAIRSSDVMHWTVTGTSDHSLISYIILCDARSPNLSLFFRRIVVEQKGRGLGKMVTKFALKFCFEEMKFHRIWLNVREDNIRAFNLYKNLGFEREGVARDAVRLKDGTFKSYNVMSMLEHEYRSRSGS